MNKKNVSKIIASSMIVANIPTSLAVELIDEKISDINNIENLGYVSPLRDKYCIKRTTS